MLAYIVLVLCVFCVSPGLAGYCPDGYCRHSNACYLPVGINVTWIEARSYCAVLGGKLFAPTTRAMQTAAAGALRRGIIKRGRYWLDITDLLNPKDWKIMSGRSSITFSDWTWVAEDATSANMTVYNGSDAQNCVYMSAEYAYTWSTANCDEKMNFLCYSTGNRNYGYNQYNRYSDDIDC